MPGLPGTPLSYLGILILIFLPNFPINLTYLVVMGVIAVIITILDYVIPIIGTKKFGGTKAGVRGSTIGLIVSIFVLPILGITIGPFGIFGIIIIIRYNHGRERDDIPLFGSHVRGGYRTEICERGI